MRSMLLVLKALVLTTLLTACGAGDQNGQPGGRPLEDAATGGLEAPAGEVDDLEEAAPTSERFVLGTHYQRLSPTQPTSSGATQVEVAEVFWYGCPHCYAFEPYISDWQEDKPAYVNFVRVHAVWNPLLQLHARAFYTAEALGKVEEMHDAFFAEIHENGNPLDSEEALAEFFGRFGVERQAFDSAFDSFEVHSKLQRAEELNRRYQISSVPSIVVNGKYTSTASMAGSYEALIALIGELVEAERPSD